MSRKVRKSSKIEKPFTPSATRKNAQLHKAMSDVREAIDALELAKASADNWADFETLVHFRGQLRAFLSSDGGECGFEPYVMANQL